MTDLNDDLASIRFGHAQPPADASEVVVVPRDEPDEAFCEGYYNAHLTHALDAMREGIPYQLNADGAFALIQQAAADRRALRNTPPAPSGDSGAWEALEKISKGGPDVSGGSKTFQSGFDKGCMWAGGVARQALALRDAGGGSLPPAAPSSVPGDDVDGGAGQHDEDGPGSTGSGNLSEVL